MVVLCETNVLSLISQRSDNYYQIQIKCYSIQQCRCSAWQSGGAESGHQLNAAQALFRSPPNSKFFHSLSITSIFSRLHGVLNVGKKKLITQFSWKSRDESFEPSWSTIGQYLPNKTKVVLFIRLKKLSK